MTAIPDGIMLLSNLGDWLTAGRLGYKNPHEQGASRFQAAALLLATGKVHRTHERGRYLVESQDPENKQMYQVCALSGDCSCDCEDATISPKNPLGLCVHILAGGYDLMILNTLGTRYTVTKPIPLVALLCDMGINQTHSTGRRQIMQRGIRLDGQIVTNTGLIIHPEQLPKVLEIGRQERVELIAVEA